MMGSNVFTRGVVLGVGLILAGVSAACSAGGGGGAPADQSAPPRASGPAINDPKDAAQGDVCSLLSAGGAASIGLEPQGKKAENTIDPKAPAGCTWSVAGEFGNRVMLTPLSDRSIQSYYDNKTQYSDFQELTIAGHPAVRANDGDPAQDGFCNIFAATKDGQVLTAQADTNSDKKVEPCGLAQKALETSIPSLPAAK